MTPICSLVLEKYHPKSYHSDIKCHISSKFQSSMTIFHHKLLTKRKWQGIGQWMNSSMTPICSLSLEECHPKSYHSDIKCHISSEFQSSMTIFHHKLLTKKRRQGIGQWMNSSITPICSLDLQKCHPKSCHSDIKGHMTLINQCSLVYSR